MAKNEFDELMSIGIDIGKDTVPHWLAFDQDGQLGFAQTDQTVGAGVRRLRSCRAALSVWRRV